MTADHPDGGTGAAARIMLRPLASSLPLGFFAFCVGSVLLSGVQLGWVPVTQTHAVMELVLAFVAPLELLAAVLAFLARDGGAATGLAVLGSAWCGVGVLLLRGPPGQRSVVVAMFLLTLVPLMALMSVAALSAKPLFGVLLGVGGVRFLCTGLYQAGLAAAFATVAGWVGVALSAFAAYGGLALLLEDTTQRTVLPLGRRGRAREALEGSLGQQVHRAEGEAGVRRLL